MSLSKEQKKELSRLSEYFKKLEELVVEDNIDLDVFMSDYSDAGYEIYSTESIGVNTRPDKRKEIFEKSQKEKTKVHAKNQ